MINRIKQTVTTILNTDGRGNVKPSELNVIVHNGVLELYEEMLFEVNQLMNRQNRGLVNGGLENTTEKVREKIQYYLTTTTLSYSGDSFILPSDLRYFDAPFYNDELIDLCKNNREFKLLANVSHTTPTEEYPIGLKQGNTLKVLPTTIEEDVTLSYLRNPLEAKWTYIKANGVELFNPSAADYQDVDIHPGQEDNLIIKVLEKFGINLKEKDVQEAMQRAKVNEFNEKNAN